MAHLTADPFAAMVDPGLFARAVAESMQLSLLPKRQYSPLSEPSRAGGPGQIDDDEAEGPDGTDRPVTDAATVANPPVTAAGLAALTTQTASTSSTQARVDSSPSTRFDAWADLRRLQVAGCARPRRP